MNSAPDSFEPYRMAFVGGGNMAQALIGGLRRQGWPASLMAVVEPLEATRAHLSATYGVKADAEATGALGDCVTVVWAVKPQMFHAAAMACQAWLNPQALHVSVAAGIRSDALARWLGTDCVVRAMPNTPALIGQGISGLFARPGVSPHQRQEVQRLLAPTGATVWLPQEGLLDAVTAVSGSGPAYVFLLMEAMAEAGVQQGLPHEVASQLALATVQGAAALAAQSGEPPQDLRAKVTSKGGTTHAAITSMQADGVPQAIVRALGAAGVRARELGDEFGREG
jgi:pyrroline-5-carboxylate reductase